jgi:hypothetical protein
MSLWFQVFIVNWMRTALFWVIMQVTLVPDCRVGTTYQSHLQGSRDGTDKLSRYVKGQEFIPFDLEPISFPQNVVKKLPLLT